MASPIKKIIHRFVYNIAEYEKGGSQANKIIPVDTQIFAYYPKDYHDPEHIPGLAFVLGDGQHTYVELREGKGLFETAREYSNVSDEDVQDLRREIKHKQDMLTSANAGDGISITGTGPNVVITNTRDEATWGKVTGDIANQTDLVNILNQKITASYDRSHERLILSFGRIGPKPTDVIDGGDVYGDQDTTIDGGSAGTTIWDLIIDGGNAGVIQGLDGGAAGGDQTDSLDGGNAGTIEWIQIIDGGNAGAVQGIDGGDVDPSQTTTEDCGVASTTIFSKVYDGGNVN